MSAGNEVHVIKSVQFGLMSEQDILKMAVCEITNPNLYNQQTLLPAEGGLLDPKMGVCMKGLVCQTCFRDIKQCPGHFGYIKLAETVFHLEFIEMIQKILQSICFNCGKLLVSAENIHHILAVKSKRKRLREIKVYRTNVCKDDETNRGCGKRQPIYRKKDKEIYIQTADTKAARMEAGDDESKRIIHASEVYEIFRRIDDETIKILGLSTEFSRPESLLIKLLVVAPPAVRPSIELTSSAKAEDDLTHLYKTILSTNFEIKTAKETGANRSRIEELTKRLQDFVGYIMNNEKNVAKQKGGRPVKSISQRLKGKEGRLRGNLMGKRVDFSSRTVVSPDPSLELDQLGVPKDIAEELTIPEVVTQLNVEFLKKLVERGDEWPGAKYYISKLHNNEIVDLKYVKQKPNLQYGDIVERHLQDGDFVIFNRQPSLHRMSIMGHRVKVLPFLSFRLNLAVTTPYNADFDGDEMNMHVPQSLESKSEVRHLMHVPKQLVTPQSNRPVMGLNQDVLMGIRLFTFRDNFIDKATVFDILMQMDDWNGEIPKPAILKPQPMWSGKQILSMVIPEINYERLADADVVEDLYDSDEAVIIRKGKILTGIFKKKIVGNTPGSLIGCLWIDFGSDKTRDFMTYSQKIINCWLLKSGFSVGIQDAIVPEDCLKEIEIKKLSVKKDFFEILQETQKINKVKIAHQPGKTIIQSFEYIVNSTLNDCRKDIGAMLNKKMSTQNNIKHMILSGSKGNDLNISQICGIVGQQNVEGQRIPFGFDRRTLPHFLKDDFGPESRGFVANSYLKGLTPEEFFFHTMGGREGLIDTAVKTSQTGYMQRRLVKALEDVMVNYDSTIRDSYGNIIQYVYGDDGMAGEFVEAQRFELPTMGDSKLKSRCFFEIDESKDDLGFEDSVNKYLDEGFISLEVRDSLLRDKHAHSKLYEEYEKLLQMREKLRELIPASDDATKLLPVNLDRAIQRALLQKRGDGPSDLSPLEVLEKLGKLCDSLEVVYREGNNPELCRFSTIVCDNATFVFRANLLLRLCSRRTVLELHFSRDSFNFLIEEILTCFNQAKSQPGEMTGSIAAQSIGETLTQMTLNTFHFAGVSSQNITLGVPRIQEIINCSHNIKGPSMSIHLKDDLKFSTEAVQRLISTLEKTTISQIANTSEVFFDPDPTKTVVPEDQDLIFIEEKEMKDASPWVLRIEIAPVLLARKGITFKQVVRKIEEKFAEPFPIQLHIVDSLETADPIVLRIRIISKHPDFNDIRKVEQTILEDLHLKGFVKKVTYKTEAVKVYSHSGRSTLPQKEMILETSGTCLDRVLRLPMVDATRTTSNDIWDVYNNFGIEATRLAILNEIRFVFKFFSIMVNYRHVSLLADTITSNGRLMSISRTGINRVYSSPLRKSSFEETVDILLEAAVYADNDKLHGVTENVMFGQLSKMGTGAFDVLMDEDYLLARPGAENVDREFKYIPQLDSTLEPEDAFETDDYMKLIHTPVHLMQTPGYREGPSGYSRPGTNDRGLMTPTITTRGNTAALQRSPVPQINSPYYRPYAAVMSPMIKPQPSPRYFPAQGNSGALSHAGSDVKFSPSSPHYNPSLNRVASPGRPQLGVFPASPAYNHNINSPYYSPNAASPSPFSLGRSGESPEMRNENKRAYDPQTPGKNSEFVKKEHADKYSDEEN